MHIKTSSFVYDATYFARQLPTLMAKLQDRK
jgi:hypothetical protein